MANPAPKIDALTSLRFFAAAAIVLHHTMGRFDVPVVLGLGAGVSFFFVLSGFVLTYVYPSFENWSVRTRFLIARFARLWPAHVVGVASTFILAWDVLRPFNPWWLLAHTLITLSMTSAWIPNNSYNFSMNGPSWSISTEFGFYFLFLLLIPNFARSWWWKLAGSLALAAALIAWCIIFDLPWRNPAVGPDIYGILYLNPLARLFEFVAGMTAALAWRKFGKSVKPGRALGTTLEFASLAFLMIVAWAFSASSAAPFWVWFGRSGSIAIPAAVLIFVMACDIGLFARALAWWPLIILGEISYSIYLLHVNILHFFHTNAPAWAPNWLVLSAAILALLASSLAVWAWIESPARRLIRGIGDRLTGGGKGRGNPVAQFTVSRQTPSLQPISPESPRGCANHHRPP